MSTPEPERVLALRDMLVAFRDAPDPEALLPTLWNYADAARRAGLLPHQMAAEFRRVFDEVHARPVLGAADRERCARLVTLLYAITPRRRGHRLST